MSPFVARPLPVMASFSWRGVGSRMGHLRCAAAAMMTPRAWATSMALRSFRAKKSFSMTMMSGCVSRRNAARSPAISARRSGSGMGFVLIVSHSIARMFAVAVISTVPRPIVAMPGSMPRIRIPLGYRCSGTGVTAHYPPSPTAVGEGTGERAKKKNNFPVIHPLPLPLPLCEGGGE